MLDPGDWIDTLRETIYRLVKLTGQDLPVKLSGHEVHVRNVVAWEVARKTIDVASEADRCKSRVVLPSLLQSLDGGSIIEMKNDTGTVLNLESLMWVYQLG